MDSLLEDCSGKSVLAKTVFSLSIQSLVKHLMRLLTGQIPGLDITDIRFVMTVPSIWNDSAKHFMRICAEQAGIPSNQLLLALEPEAASIHCQYLQTEKIKGSDNLHDLGMAKPGTRYMVVDLGGGTTDITVHEKVSNGHLKELCFATGNDCGGTSIDGRYFQLFVKIVGGPVMKTLKDEELGSYLDLLRKFETVKRTIRPNQTDKVTIDIPYPALDELCQTILGENFKEVLTSSKLSKNISIKTGKLKADADVMEELFTATIDDIISLIRDLLESPKAEGVSQLLLVGGFSKSMLVLDAIKNAFPDKKVITPEEPSLSVLRGAVLFGHKPNYIESRIIRFTYGLSTRDDWSPEMYDEKHLREVDGVQICDNLFDVIVRKNDTVEIGTAFERELVTSQRVQDVMEIKLFVSTKENPKYIDEEGCKFFGSASICFSEPCTEKRTIKIGFIFGNTELGVHAEDIKSGNKFKSTFNLL